MPPDEEKHIMGYGLRWSVVLPLGRDSATGKQVYHHKSLRGPKANARAYRDWYAGLIASGEPPKEAVSQAELKELGDLELKAAEFKGKLLARVRAGAKVQPGLLSL
jgi:hypothetical protein